jgi:hypothetical protein
MGPRFVLKADEPLALIGWIYFFNCMTISKSHSKKSTSFLLKIHQHTTKSNCWDCIHQSDIISKIEGVF